MEKYNEEKEEKSIKLGGCFIFGITRAVNSDGQSALTVNWQGKDSGRMPSYGRFC
jgi:hypothetical protein